MGMVTSLGVGKHDNWTALTRGRSGIRAINRFEVKGLRTGIGGTIDSDGLGALPSTIRTERIAHAALEEALAEAELAAGNLPAPLFVGLPPREVEWPQRLALALEIGGGRGVSWDEVIAGSSRGHHRELHPVYLPGATASRLAHVRETASAGCRRRRYGRCTPGTPEMSRCGSPQT